MDWPKDWPFNREHSDLDEMENISLSEVKKKPKKSPRNRNGRGKKRPKPHRLSKPNPTNSPAKGSQQSPSDQETQAFPTNPPVKSEALSLQQTNIVTETEPSFQSSSSSSPVIIPDEQNDVNPEMSSLANLLADNSSTSPADRNVVTTESQSSTGQSSLLNIDQTTHEKSK